MKTNKVKRSKKDREEAPPQSRNDKFKKMIQTPGGFVQVQGLPCAVRVDVGNEHQAEWQWLTLEEATDFRDALDASISAAESGKSVKVPAATKLIQELEGLLSIYQERIKELHEEIRVGGTPNELGEKTVEAGTLSDVCKDVRKLFEG